jgi:hypothetical protein
MPVRGVFDDAYGLIFIYYFEIAHRQQQRLADPQIDSAATPEATSPLSSELKLVIETRKLSIFLSSFSSYTPIFNGVG